MKNRLAQFPFCIVRVDKILILKRTSKENLHNLAMVLKILSDCGCVLSYKNVSLWHLKLSFSAVSFQKMGCAQTRERQKQSLMGPDPYNFKQSKSFLGMLTYYHHHLPKILHVLEPLHKLLRLIMQ